MITIDLAHTLLFDRAHSCYQSLCDHSHFFPLSLVALHVVFQDQSIIVAYIRDDERPDDLGSANFMQTDNTAVIRAEGFCGIEKVFQARPG